MSTHLTSCRWVPSLTSPSQRGRSGATPHLSLILPPNTLCLFGARTAEKAISCVKYAGRSGDLLRPHIQQASPDALAGSPVTPQEARKQLPQHHTHEDVPMGPANGASPWALSSGLHTWSSRHRVRAERKGGCGDPVHPNSVLTVIPPLWASSAEPGCGLNKTRPNQARERVS